jgi:hypothetical protein
MLGNFFRRSTNLKQRVNEKQNVEKDSAASRGCQGKYVNENDRFPWRLLEAALSILNVSLFS